MTLNEYLMALQEHPDRFFQWPDVPDEWVARACQLWVVEQRLWDSIAENSNKGSGCVLWFTERVLGLLARGLTNEQVIALYVYYREDYPTPEGEAAIRSKFQRVFPRQSANLPPPFTKKEVRERLSPDPPPGTRFEDGDTPF